MKRYQIKASFILLAFFVFIEKGGAEENPQKVTVVLQNTNPNSVATKCGPILAPTPPPATQPTDPSQQECNVLKNLSTSSGNGGSLSDITPPEVKKSIGDLIECKRSFSYTIDFNGCKSALNIYNSVVLAEKALDVSQLVNTQQKNNQILNTTTEKIKKDSDVTTASMDAGIESNNHSKEMEDQKITAFSVATGALVMAINQIPGEKKAMELCSKATASAPASGKNPPIDSANLNTCKSVFNKYKAGILANQDAKAILLERSTYYAAKAAKAIQDSKKFGAAAAAIDQSKKSIATPEEDMMVEFCAAYPQDPKCKTASGPRVNGNAFNPGEFSFGSQGQNQAFNLDPEAKPFGEDGVTPTTDEGPQVGNVNSPFKDEAERAREIVNPAPAAQVQGKDAAAGGGGSGAGGGGGGSASLGNDTQGQDKDAPKEPQIKPNKAENVYSNSGGGGYKGINNPKEQANPFASLFDKKSEGGIEEERGIASQDIDSKASGLFEKISNRYGKIHAEKRIEQPEIE